MTIKELCNKCSDCDICPFYPICGLNDELYHLFSGVNTGHNIIITRAIIETAKRLREK